MIFPFIDEMSLNMTYDSYVIKFYIGDKYRKLLQTHYLFEINCNGIHLFGNIGGCAHHIDKRLDLQSNNKLIINGVDEI